jgi:1A family penicillin-binding protein
MIHDSFHSHYTSFLLQLVGSYIEESQMLQQYYSNWNRNHKSRFKKALQSLIQYPAALINKIRNEKNLRRKIWRVIIYLAASFLLAGSLIFAAISLTLPDPNKLNARIIPQSTKIYARDGTTLLYEIHGEAKRTLLNFSDIPANVKNATVAIEDKNFYKNPGVSLTGILRSIFVDLTSGSLSQGGSTITQQFVRNAILTREKTITRKVKEIVLAIELDQRYSKDDILKLYLNEIPYGQNAYGIEAAAQTYFGKHAQDLTLAESAYLAALPQAPSFYNPNGPNRDRLDARKNVVLDQMFEQGYITKDQRDAAKNEKVVFGKIKDAILAPHFVMYVQSILAQKYGETTLEEGGLNVVTTLDWNLQQIADKAVKDGVALNEKKKNLASNASLVAIDPKTGQILAMVGSRDYFDDDYDGQVNVALQPEQPGSSTKPYIYATAFKQGMSPATMLMDVKTVFGTYNGKNYAPGNYDGLDHGIVNIRKAFAGSLNIPAVKTLALVGVQNAIDTEKDLGITSDISADKCGLALVLGGCEVTLLDHTSAMGVFANGGVKHDDTPILKITDSSGKVLEEYQDNPGIGVLDPQVAYQVVSVMTDNDARAFVFGASSPLILPGRVVAAKTGTTQNWRDGWTMGYTPSLVAGVWTGNNDGSYMRPGADGVVVAAPIWNQFMREALKGTPAEQFSEPSGIQHILVDAISGKLPTEFTQTTKTEIFASNALPKDFDDVHVAVKINKLNGKKATDQTPVANVETKIFTILHSEMPNNPDWENPVQSWAIANGYPYPPTELDDGTTTSSQSSFNLNFISPTDNQTVTKLPLTVQVSVDGTVPTSIDLYLNGALVSNKNSSPYSFNVTKADKGTTTLMAIAHLPGGGVIQKNIQINIQ